MSPAIFKQIRHAPATKSQRNDGSKIRKRYRYYVSQQAIRQGYATSTLKAVNADLLEDAVRHMLSRALPRLAHHLTDDGLTPDQLCHRLDQHASLLARMKSPLDLAATIHVLAPKIVVETGRIQIHLTTARLTKLAAQPVAELPENRPSPSFAVELESEPDGVVITAAVELTYCRGRAEIIDAQTGQVATAGRTEPKTSLIQALVQAEYWRAELLKDPAASLQDLLKARNLQPGYIRRLMNAAYLAPAIKRTIFQGTQPAGLQVQDLLKPRSMDWSVQMRELGFVETETATCH